MPPFAPPTGSSDGLLIRSYQLLAERKVRGDEMSNETLLLHDAAGGVNHFETEFLDQTIILVQDLPLEQPEAFGGIRAPAEVHAGLVELELDPSRHQAIEGGIDGHTKIQRKV